MSRLRAWGALAVVALCILAGCGGTSTASTHATFKHIFVIMMENQSADQIYGNTADAPYINGSLVGTYGIAKNYYGVTHPSLPNYLALISGDHQGIWDDCAPGADSTCTPEDFCAACSDFPGSLTATQEKAAATQPHLFDGPTIIDQLEAKQLTWRAYMESMPMPGFLGASNAHALYAVKHNPFVYFKNIYNNPARLANIVPFTAEGFAQDLMGTVPNFVWITPNQCDDMHGLSITDAAAENVAQCGNPASGVNHGTIQAGDAFLAKVVPLIMGSKAWSEGSALVIVWDENDYSGDSGCCHAPVGANGTTLGGGNAPVIIVSFQRTGAITDTATAYNHYSLLATIEKLWGLDCLANACGFKDADLMTKFFQ